MSTLTIEIPDDNALRLIQDLEAHNIVRVVPSSIPKSGNKLSEMLYGSISEEQAAVMHKELKQMRDEWTKDTF